MEKEELVKTIREFIRQERPGALTVLNPLAYRVYGKSYPEILASGDIDKALNLIKACATGEAIKLLVKKLIARPLARLLGLGIDEEVVANKLLKGSIDEARELLEVNRLVEERIHKELKRMLSCLKLIERITVDIYEKLADKLSNNPITTAALKYVSNGSRSHEMVVTKLALYLNMELPENTNELIKVCNISSGLLSWLVEKHNSLDDIEERSLLSLLTMLSDVEKIAGEEEYTRILLPFLKALLQGDSQTEIVYTLIESIIRDEENHEKIVKKIFKILSQNNKPLKGKKE